jgi:hypothetical protein
MSRERILVAAILLTACGGAPPPTPAPTPSDTASASAAPSASATKPEGEADKPFTEIPTACDGKAAKICTPPDAFVKRLCGGSFPDVALAMFAKGTPWTRGYVRREVEAWNASGGASSSDKLALDEEVLIVAHRAADTGGMVVSGASGSYDILRWDGHCASLMGEEVSTRAPASPKNARIPWRSLGEPIRDALFADEKVGKIAAERKKECKGQTMGEVSGKCEKVDTQLSVAIANYVRGGGSLPPPSKLP